MLSHCFPSELWDLLNTNNCEWEHLKKNDDDNDLKGKFSSGIEGALASTLHHDFNCKQLSEMMLCIVLLMFLSLFV